MWLEVVVNYSGVDPDIYKATQRKTTTNLSYDTSHRTAIPFGAGILFSILAHPVFKM
jgi:hypothetical protein